MGESVLIESSMIFWYGRLSDDSPLAGSCLCRSPSVADEYPLPVSGWIGGGAGVLPGGPGEPGGPGAALSSGGLVLAPMAAAAMVT